MGMGGLLLRLRYSPILQGNLSGLKIYGSLRLNLTQHGETHQVDKSAFVTMSGPGKVGKSSPASIQSPHVRKSSFSGARQTLGVWRLVQHQLVQGTPSTEKVDPVVS